MKNRLKSLLFIIVSILAAPIKKHVEPLFEFLEKFEQYAQKHTVEEILAVNRNVLAASFYETISLLPNRHSSITEGFLQLLLSDVGSIANPIAVYLQSSYIGGSIEARYTVEMSMRKFVPLIGTDMLKLMAFMNYNEIQEKTLRDAIATKLLMLGTFGNTPYTETEAKFIVAVYRFFKS